MRRWIAPLILVAGLAIGGCSTSNKSDNSVPVQSEIPKVVVTTPSSLPSAVPTLDGALVSKANPCDLIRTGDLNKVFTVDGKQAVFSPVDTLNPPVTDDKFAKRACGYTGTVAGTYTDQPVDGTSVTIMVTTQVDNKANGIAWHAATQAGQVIGSTTIPGLGDGAFRMERGHVVARKGRVIVEVNALIDTDKVTTDSIAEKLVNTALSRSAG